MTLAILVRAGARALDAVSDSFAPTRGASSSQIRRNGLLCLGIGIVCFVLTCGLIFVAPTQPMLALLPVFLAYAFMVVGAYRAVFGKTPEPAHPGELSFQRVAFAVGTIVVVFAAIFGLMFLGNLLYEHMKTLG
jgi:hypothetical protein